jgi:hypothetical protein
MSFPQVTMPGRSTQQNLRNFVLRLEPLALVNAELLFGNIKIGRERTRSALSLTAALGQNLTSRRVRFRAQSGLRSKISVGLHLERLAARLGRLRWLSCLDQHFRPVALVAGFAAFAGVAFLPTLR